MEDDPGLRTLYRTVLMEAGFMVVAVEDGIDALRHVELSAPSAVVLDLDLPRLGGRDVQAELAAHSVTANIPIIVVTGGDTADLDRTAYACVLQKPISPEDLVEAVHSCLRGRGI